MISIPSFRQLLYGLDPVIAVPKREPVTFAGFTFRGVGLAGMCYLPDSRLLISFPTMRDVARNPVLPPWEDGWPDEVHEVPYPARQRAPAYEWVADPFAPAGQIFFVVPINFDGRSIVDVLMARMNQCAEAAPTWSWSIPQDPNSWDVAPAPIRVAGDQESVVGSDTVETLVDLARKDQYDDFMWLAASVGVPKDQRDELWRGTRARIAPKD